MGQHAEVAVGLARRIGLAPRSWPSASETRRSSETEGDRLAGPQGDLVFQRREDRTEDRHGPHNLPVVAHDRQGDADLVLAWGESDGERPGPGRNRRAHALALADRDEVEVRPGTGPTSPSRPRPCPRR